ncbi:uncharacterized protein BX664DRAFT_362401 [Halteromyces radiatus]|uniref:uncharacterized protein n=1 Tax=Halteromyces radiatus TaxID=101107 RepID=UPI00221FC969|nr:uncharacterized protein BX664DRAFT_362401 [Halteromyces radiatus]KAI8078852.1 hypothetical protein BX664DRAFT_362401 [Halteromyces radiatus]
MNKVMIFIIFTLISLVLAETPSQRFLQGCDVLGTKIVCFGGSISGSVDVFHQFQPTNEFYSLDVSQSLSPNQAKTNWEVVPSPNNYVLEPRAEFGHAVVNSTKWVILSGAGSGQNYSQPTLVNVSAIYDITTNQWITYKQQGTLFFDNGKQPPIDYTVSPAFTQLIGTGACSYTVQGTTKTPAIALDGGLSLSNATLIDATITPVYQMATPNNGDWNQMNVTALEKPGTFFQTIREQCAYTTNKLLFSFGGIGYNATLQTSFPFYNGTDDASQASSFSDFAYFDFKAGTFNISYIDSTQLTPSVRYWHTLTSLPGTNKILMYGGVYNHVVSLDYCLIFDGVALRWSAPDFSSSNNIPGPRYGHSAVMVGQDTLYIMMGADITHQLKNDVYILNVTSMQWFNADSNSTWLTAGNNENNANQSSSSLSPGAIAGAVIGGVAGLSLLVVAAVVFIYIRKRKRQLEEIPPQPDMFFDNNNNGPLLSDNHNENIKPSEPQHEPTNLFKPSEVQHDDEHTTLFKPDMGDDDVKDIMTKPMDTSSLTKPHLQ